MTLWVYTKSTVQGAGIEQREHDVPMLIGYGSTKLQKLCEERLPDGTPDLKTVTAIEIASVEDYHDG